MRNLISISQTTKPGKIAYLFTDTDCIVIDKKKGEIIATGEIHEGVF